MKLRLLSPLFVVVLFVSGCVKLEFDAPPPTPLCDWVATSTIAQLKAMHTFGTTQVIDEDLIISGVVVADDSSGNFYRNLVIQDETAGIEVRFGVTELYNEFPTGRQVYVNCKGLTLSDYNGVTQIGEIQEAVLEEHICKGAQNQTITPKVVTIADLNVDLISTLIQLDNVQFASGSAGAPFADAVNLESVNHTIEECNGQNTVLLRSSGYADFATQLTSTGSGSIIAVYSVFGDDQQLYIRNPRDVAFDQERCEKPLFETFEEQPDNTDINMSGWTNVAVKGERRWQGDSFGGNSFAQATAFNDTSNEMETWLITPPINLSTPKTLKFESATAFHVHDGLTVMISTDYAGDIATATWETLPCLLAGDSDPNYEFVLSGDVDLSGYSGTGYIAFRYIGNKNDQTSTYRLDNIQILAQ